MAFTLENQLNTLNDSLYQATRFMQRDFGEIVHLQSSKRGVDDFVNKCYSRLQNKITGSLLERRPQYGLILSNEPAPQNCEYFFVVEPVSGLANFKHGIPFCCMAVALFGQHKDGTNEALAISIHNPILRETFYAAKAKGAWSENFNETVVPKSRMRVSTQGDFSNAIASSSLSNDAFVQNRNFGSDLLEMAYLAAGRVDIVMHQTENILTDAGLMLVREAGGYIELKNDKFLATNDALQKQVSEVFQNIVVQNNE